MTVSTRTKGLKRIGRGLFTTCYRLDANTVMLKSSDPIKECMALGWFPVSEHFPLVTCVTDGIYKMQYFPKTASLKKNLDADQWQLYKHLKDLFNTFWLPNDRACRRLAWLKHFDNLPEQFSSTREALQEAIDAIGNYGEDVCFEISPRNVRACNGKLILLDCFFLYSAFIEKHESKGWY